MLSRGTANRSKEGSSTSGVTNTSGFVASTTIATTLITSAMPENTQVA